MDFLKPYHQQLMAGVLAYSNTGCVTPTNLRRDQFFREFDVLSKHTIVEWFMSDRIESDEHYDILIEELDCWWDTTAEDLQKNHVEHWHTYLRMVKSARWSHANAARQGASNQRMLARCLSEAVNDCQDERIDLKEDAAVQMILLQVATLLGQGTIVPMETYRRWDDKITDMLKEYERWDVSGKIPA